MKKKFKDTKFAKFLNEKSPAILTALDIADDFFPPVKMLTALAENTIGLNHGEREEIKAEIQTYANTEYKDYLADKQDARATSVAIQTSEHVPMFTKVAPTVIAYFLVLIWGATTIYIIGVMMNVIHRQPGVNYESVLAIYAAITGMASSVKDFFFGSSSGSKENSAALRKMAQSE